MIKWLLCASVLSTVSLFADWGTPFDVYTASSAGSPVVAINNAGNGVVSYSIMGSAAGATQIVNGAPFNPVSYPAIDGTIRSTNVAMNGAGNATLVWAEIRDDLGSIIAVRSASLLNNVWSPISPIADELSNVLLEDALASPAPGVTKDNLNNSIALWNNAFLIGGDQNIAYNLYQSGLWTGENFLLGPSTDILESAFLSGSPNGHGFAIWFNSTTSVLQGSYYNGSNWTTNLNISSDIISPFPPMNISMNSSNEALIAWVKSSNEVSAILFSGGSYGSDETIAAPQGNFVPNGLAVALNDGVGAAAWVEVDTITSETNLYLAFRINNIWQTPLLLDSVSIGVLALSSPRVKLDDKGNAYVVWERGISTEHSIVGLRVTKGANAAPSFVLISTNNPTQSSNPSLAVNGSGQTIVSWESGPRGNHIIEAAVGSFSSGVSPPLNLRGIQLITKFVSQTERLNKIRWSPSLDPSVQKYYIFRNDVLVKTVLASCPLKFKDHNQRKCPATYKVTAVNAENVQSEPVVIRVP